jgi:hypothetical protein
MYSSNVGRLAATLAVVGGVSLYATAALSGPTIVATIQGAYDKDGYDTPELDFFNTSGGTLTNASITLVGYQGLNNGVVLKVNLADFGAGQTDLVWGSLPGVSGATTPGNLAAYDYDDEWGNTPAGYTNPDCVVGASLCSVVGNFRVIFSATVSGGTYDGQSVYSVFSPTSNYTGGFVGWEGLDPTGLSETVYDDHSGTFGGTMAIIQLGTAPGIPEPAAWAMMILGVGAAGGALRLGRTTAKT